MRKTIKPMAVAVEIFLSYILLVDLLKPRVYLTVNRCTSMGVLELHVAENPLILLTVGALSLVLLYRGRDRLMEAFYGTVFVSIITVILVLGYVLHAAYLALLFSITSILYCLFREPKDLSTVFSVFFMLVAGLSLLASVRYLVYPFTGGRLYEGWDWLPAQLDMKLYYSLQPLLTGVTVVLPYLVFLRAFLFHKIGFKLRFKVPGVAGRNVENGGSVLETNVKWLILALSLATAFLSNIYPYMPALNPSFKPAGVDIPHYAQALENMSARPVLNAFIFRGSRPLYMLVLYGFQKMLGLSPYAASVFFPSILLSVLVASTYISLRSLGDEDIAVLSAFFTATGFKTTVGIYSSFQADLLALSLSYPLTVLALKNGGWRRILVLATLAFLMDYIHPWTLTQTLVAVFFMALLSLVTRDRRGLKTSATAFLVVVASTLAADYIKSMIRATGATEATQSIAKTSIGLEYFWSFINQMVFATNILYGGFLLTPLLPLALLLLLKKPTEDPYTKLTYAWILTALPIVIANSTVQSRLYYNIPLEVAYAIALKTLGKKLPPLRRPLIILLFSVSLTYLLQSLANLHYIG